MDLLGFCSEASENLELGFLGVRGLLRAARQHRAGVHLPWETLTNVLTMTVTFLGNPDEFGFFCISVFSP